MQISLYQLMMHSAQFLGPRIFYFILYLDFPDLEFTLFFSSLGLFYQLGKLSLSSS